MIHLRMLEWVRRSNHVGATGPALDALVRRAWTRIAREQRALLLMPALTVRAIEDALAVRRSGLVFVAGVLLAAEEAVSVSLSNDFRELLRKVQGG